MKAPAAAEHLDPSVNVILFDVDTGETLFETHNAITTLHRQEYAKFLEGQSVVPPRYVAVGARAPGTNVTTTEFRQLLSETARSGVGRPLLEGSAETTTRIAATLGAGIGASIIREAGLLSSAESTEMVDNCDVPTGWLSDGGTVGITTTEHVEGVAALITTRDAASEARSFYRTTLAVDASGLSAAAAHLQFWYYVDDASLLGSGHSVELAFGAATPTASNITPSGGAFVDGWNFFDIPLNRFSAGIDLSVNLTGFALRIVKSNATEIAERLDAVRLWQPSGILWAYTPITPALPKAPHQTIGIYWYLSIDIAAEPVAAESFAFEQRTVGSSVMQLDAAVYLPTNGTRASQALIQNTGSSTIRYRTDGGADPASSSGHQLAPGDSILLRTYNEITRFRAVREGGSNSALAASYRR